MELNLGLLVLLTTELKCLLMLAQLRFWEKKKKIVGTKFWKKSKDNMWYGFAAVIEHKMILMTGFPQFPLNKV